MNFRRLCVFCGSNLGINPLYRQAAEQLGTVLASRGLELVYGGGNIGLMGVLADTVLAAGGRVTGVIPEALMARELGHRDLTNLRVVKSMHERKALMADLSDAFIAMPGGFGTFEEFCEIVTWSQLGLHQKPCGLFNVNDFFSPLLQLFDQAVAEGFLSEQNRQLVIAGRNPVRLLEKMAQFRAPAVGKWIGRDES
jgi:uncharacterized protein (TIGR00730 family)